MLERKYCMKENKTIVITMVLNLIVAVIKLTSGILFSFSTLIADSVQSFIDFITDITSIIANKIGKRRANKTYPFGYGQVYYLANLFTGFLLFLIGIFILYQLFYFEGAIAVDSKLFLILGIVLVLKYIVVKILKYYGAKFKSELMVEAAKESYTDFISTCVVLLVFILTIFEEYIPGNINIDKIGSLCMCIYVFYTSIRMMIHNISGMLANDSENSDVKVEIIHEFEKYEEIKVKSVEVIKMSAYYTIFIKIIVDENITVGDYLKIERKIKNRLRFKNKLYRCIDIEPI